ncbi:MAG: hypothetical protein JJT89_08100 [Nitriliruptoraceae bacterium]|nr:hypothetical protein [Nitriliruptoraceae bacterium]
MPTTTAPTPDAHDAEHTGAAGPAAREDVAPTRRPPLGTFRRYCFYSVIGSLLLLLWFGSVPAAIEPDAAGWSLPVLALGLLVTSVAVWIVTDAHIPLRGVARAPDVARRWLLIGCVGAAVHAVAVLERTVTPFWAIAPLSMLALTLAGAPMRRQVRLGTLGILCLTAAGAVAAGVLTDPAADAVGEQVFGVIWTGAMVLSVVIASIWTWDVAAELDRARATAAALAVADERLRFAAELHDIQGHHLQVIALKSELAARLIHTDASRAGTEMEQVRALAATALTETRELVHGYRRTTVAAELTNASNVLASASIDAQVDAVRHGGQDGLGDDLDPASRHLLGLVVREATTNVLRHSDARTTRFVLAHEPAAVRLTISNDGVTHPEDATDPSGSGLRSLQERLERAGGALSVRTEGAWFTLEATVPVVHAASDEPGTAP